MLASDGVRPLERLELDIDGRHIEAELVRFPAPRSGVGRQPRWMLKYDGGPLTKGPLTWDGLLVEEVEKVAIVEYVRDRQRVAAQYRAEHGERLRRMSDEGSLGVVADALGVPPSDLLADPTVGG